MDLSSVRLRLETRFGPACLTRVDRDTEALVQRVVNGIWWGLPSWVGPVEPPGVIAVHTDELFPHTRTRRGESVIVFDDSLRVLCSAFTRILVTSAGRSQAIVVIDKILGQRLMFRGRLVHAAAIAQLALTDESVMVRAPGGGTRDDVLIDRLTIGQVTFIAAHEAYHVVLRTSEAAGLLTMMFEFDIDLYQNGPLVRRSPAGIDAAHVWEILSLVHFLDEVGSSADVDRARQVQAVVDALDDSRLREEMVCDLYAAITTHEELIRSGISERVAVASSIMALVNMTWFHFLDLQAASDPDRAARVLRELVIRLEALIGALLSRVIQGARDHGKDVDMVLSALLENIAMSLRWCASVRDAIIRRHWASAPERWLNGSDARLAWAERLAAEPEMLHRLLDFSGGGGGDR